MGTTERIGVFGGTFDPIHVAHIAVGVAARHQLALDRVLFVVANVPWQKASLRRISAPEHRYSMVEATLASYAGLEPSRLELDRGGDSYTIDTLEALVSPNRELFLVVGADIVDELTTWKHWEDLPRLCTLAVARRGGEADAGPAPGGWPRVDVSLPALELSSTELRAMAREGRPLEPLVPAAALSIIEREQLYSA